MSATCGHSRPSLAGEVTTVIMQFKLPNLPHSMGNPLSPRTGGHEYVWHCHILEHEEHDMMRPFVVKPKHGFV